MTEPQNIPNELKGRFTLHNILCIEAGISDCEEAERIEKLIRLLPEFARPQTELQGRSLTKDEFHSILSEFPPSIAEDSGQPEWTKAEIDKLWNFLIGKNRWIKTEPRGECNHEWVGNAFGATHCKLCGAPVFSLEEAKELPQDDINIPKRETWAWHWKVRWQSVQRHNKELEAEIVDLKQKIKELTGDYELVCEQNKRMREKGEVK